MTLRVSSLQEEGVYEASKYVKLQALVSREELAELMNSVGGLWIYLLTGIGDGEPIAKEAFLEAYGSWIEELKAGRVPDTKSLRKVLAAAWTVDESSLWKQKISEGRFLVKMSAPVVDVQAHFFTWSKIDGVFRPMTMGPGQIFWGLQFAFPGLYQDPKTMDIAEARGPNREIFNKVRQWARDHTRATPFVAGGVKVNSPIRLGKSCFSWIEKHPQLKEMGIHVSASG